MNEETVSKRPRVVIAGTNSGVGKTTLTVGLMAALVRRGLQVQGYKVGPDYIDPTYHSAVTGRPSRNLDSWMLSADTVREVFLRSSHTADVSIIEGVMGLYDGKDPRSNLGSTADLSQLLAVPVILVVNAASMARSAAAIVMGFQRFDPGVKIAGVIVNRVSGERHYQLVKTAVEQECGVPTLGYLTEQADLIIPERHLGLIPAIERGELQPLFEQLAVAIEETIDLDQLLQIVHLAPALAVREPMIFRSQQSGSQVTIAIAKDAAFNFYYPENLELLELRGAKLVFFSPLAGEDIPSGVDGLYLGGGFPEEFAQELGSRPELLKSFRDQIQRGLPTYAECGGYMFLTEAIIDRQGDSFPMVGIIPAKVRMQERLAALGYREVTALTDNVLLPAGCTARGHEFHYSTIEPSPDFADVEWPFAYEVQSRGSNMRDGFAKGNLLAGYTHLHFASHPEIADRFIAVCASYQELHITNEKQKKR